MKRLALAVLAVLGLGSSPALACGAPPAGVASSNVVMALVAASGQAMTGPRSGFSAWAAGQIAYDSTNNRLIICDGTAWRNILASAGTTATAAGSTGQIQFNSAGALGADAGLHWDDTNKRLGLGTATPTAALHVKLPGTGVNIRLDKDSTNPQITFANAGTDKWGIYQQAATDSFRFRNWDDATDVLVLDNTNAVGIGISPDPSSALDVSSTERGFLPPRMTGAERDAITSPANGLVVYNTTTNALNLRANGAWVALGTGSSNVAVAGSSGQIQFNNAGALGADAGLHWDNTNKRLGIGTSGPTGHLHIRGPASSDGVVVIDQADAAGTARPVLYFTKNAQNRASFSYAANGNEFYFDQWNGTVSTNRISIASDGRMWFRGAAGSSEERLHIATNGAVGIGTTTPSHLLQVGNGTSLVVTEIRGDGPNYDAGLRVWNDNTATTAAAYIDFGLGSSNAVAAIHARKQTDGSNDLVLQASNSSAVRSDHVYVDGSTGNVGIGTVTPDAALDIVTGHQTTNMTAAIRLRSTTGNYAGIALDAPAPGASKSVFIHYGDHVGGGMENQLRLGRYGDNFGLWEANPVIFDMDAPNMAFFLAGSGNVGFGGISPLHPLHMASGAHITTGGVWTNASDARLKTAVHPLGYGLSDLLKLKPVAYTFRADGSKQIGFLAQDVRAVMPELVTGKEGDIAKGETLGLSYGQLTAVLVEAVRELKADNDNLLDTVKVLQAEVEALKAQTYK